MRKADHCVSFLPSQIEAPVKTISPRFGSLAAVCNVLGIIMAMCIVISLGYYTGLFAQQLKADAARAATQEEASYLSRSLKALPQGMYVSSQATESDPGFPPSGGLSLTRERRNLYLKLADTPPDSSEPVLRLRIIEAPKPWSFRDFLKGSWLG